MPASIHYTTTNTCLSYDGEQQSHAYGDRVKHIAQPTAHSFLNRISHSMTPT